MTIAVDDLTRKSEERDVPISGVALRSLRSRLDQLGYATIYRLISTWPLGRGFRRRLNDRISCLSKNTHLAFELFYLGRKIVRDSIEDVFGAALVAELLQMKIVVARGHGCLASAWQLEIDGDNYLFTEGTLRDPLGVYHAADSRFLSHMLEGRRGDRCLDLCSGTGVQGLRLARQAEHVDSVDLNIRAIKLSQINYAINDLDDCAHLYHGDLWDALPDARSYDHIVCNPPLVPVAEGVPYPICGDGGRDGLDVTNRILAGLEKHLADGGRCTMIGACMKSCDGLGIAESIATHLTPQFSCGIFILSSLPLSEWVRQTAASTSLLYPGFSAGRAILRARVEYAESLRTDSVVCFLLNIWRSQRIGAVDVSDFSSSRNANACFVESDRGGDKSP